MFLIKMEEWSDMLGCVGGGLTCEYPDVGGEYIYTAAIGDGYTGEFESQEQREHHLNAIADEIIKKMGA